MTGHIGSKTQYDFLKSVLKGHVWYYPAEGLLGLDQFVGASIKGQTAVARVVRKRGWITHGNEARCDVTLTPEGLRVFDEAKAKNRFGDQKPLAQTFDIADGTITVHNESGVCVVDITERGQELKRLILNSADALKLAVAISYLMTPSSD